MTSTMCLALLNALGPSGCPPDLEPSLEAEAHGRDRMSILRTLDLGCKAERKTETRLGRRYWYFFW